MAQKLRFDETSAILIGDPEPLDGVKIFNTSLPEPSGTSSNSNSSNSMNFYKCASVDTTLSTWTGYKAIQDQTTNIYTFEETITSGLTYNNIIPLTGNVYSNNALIKANLYEYLIPQNNLLISALPDINWIPDNYISNWGSFTQSDPSKQPQIGIINNVIGIKVNLNDEMTATSLSSISNDFTYLHKIYITNESNQTNYNISTITLLNDNTWHGAVDGFGGDNIGPFLILSKQGVDYIDSYKIDSLSPGIYTIAITFQASSGKTKFYLNGIKLIEKIYSVSFEHSSTFYYKQENTVDNILILGLAAYNRVLSDTEISNINW